MNLPLPLLGRLQSFQKQLIQFREFVYLVHQELGQKFVRRVALQ
jgi:hypothetical protein